MSALSTARMKEFTLLKSVSVGRLFQTFITRLIENRLRTIWYNWAYIILAMSSCYITDEEHKKIVTRHINKTKNYFITIDKVTV